MNFFKYVRKYGFMHTCDMAFNRIIPVWLFRFLSGVVYELDMDRLCQEHESFESQKSCDSDFKIRRVDADDERAQLRVLTWNSTPLEVAGDDWGYCVFDRNDPAQMFGGVWCSQSQFQEVELGYKIQLKPNESYVYCAFIDKSTRGQGTYKRLLAFVAQDLKSKGHDRLLVMAQPINRASTYIHKKYSLNVVGQVRIVRFLNWAAVFKSGRIQADRVLTTGAQSSPINLIFKSRDFVAGASSHVDQNPAESSQARSGAREAALIKETS